jgi:DNA invertase Pin-like site-specific DNA recombinase
MNEQIKAGAWFRVSTGHQTDANQVPEVEAFGKHHSYVISERYQVSDSAWKNGGGDEYKATLQRALDDAWAGKFSVLVVWSLDRIVRQGPEDALRIFRQFSERGCTILSVKESWLNGSAEVQSLLIAFAGWMAERESARRSERIKAGLERKRAADPDFKQGRKPGATDKGKRRRSGYVAAWEEGGARRQAAEHAKGDTP